LLAVHLNFYNFAHPSSKPVDILNMYAIVDIGGQQFKVEKEDKVCINRIKGEVGSKVDLDKVLFINNEGNVKIGTPYLKDAVVTGKILSHFKDKKIRIFKKKKRKGYKVLNGHRQFLTEIIIEDISEKRTFREAKAETQPSEKQEKAKSETPKKEAGVKAEKPARPVAKKGSPVKPEAKKGAQVKAVAESKEKVKTATAKKKTATAKKKTATAKKKTATVKKTAGSKPSKSTNTKK
jgi:large subunit ribosomal protein L21